MERLARVHKSSAEHKSMHRQPCLLWETLQGHHQGIVAALDLNPAHLHLVQLSCSCC